MEEKKLESDSQMTPHKYTKASVESQNKTMVFKSQVEEAAEKQGETAIYL